MREFSNHFKSILFGTFLVALPLFYGNFNHIFRNEIIYCGTLIFVAIMSVLVVRKNFLLENLRGLDIAILVFFLCGILNIVFIRNGKFDQFIIYKWVAVAGSYFIVKHLNNNYILLYSLVVSGCLQSTIAFLQKTGILASNNLMFAVSGSFGNPGQLGGYLAVCIVITILLIINTIEKKNKLQIFALSVCVILQLCALYFADSRAAFLGLAVGLTFYFLPKIRKHKKLIISTIISIIFAAGILLYFYRPASANARLLIWRISAEMIADKPLLGHGTEAFPEKYMLYQAQYFAENPNSVFVSVADNAAYPFNELLNITIQYGLVGLLIVLAVFYFAFQTKGANIFKAALAVLTTFAMFSYPSAVFPLLLQFSVCLGGIFGTRITRIVQINTDFKRICFYVFLVVLMFFALKNIIFLNQLSNDISKNIFTEQSYEKMRYNRSYRDYYMNYLIEQPNTEHSERITEILSSCENYCLLGEYFISKKEYKKAEATLHTAADMIPTRIRPKYLLWRLYVETENTPAALKVAQKIMETPVKIESVFTIKVKMQMKKYLTEKE